MVSLARPRASSQATAMPPTPWLWAGAGAVVGLLVSIVLHAPAHWLARAVALASGERVLLRQAQGSVWSGSSELVLTGGPGSADAVRLPGTLHWDIRPQLGGLQLQLRADCCTPQPMRLDLHWLRWNGVQITLADHQSNWPADLLSGLGTPWNTVQVRGQLSATSRDLQLQWTPGQLQMQGQLQLDAQSIASRLSTLVPMGSYRLTIAGGASPSVLLQTLSGSLQLEGQGQWVGQRLRFSGVASAAPERVEALSNLLNIVGRRDGARSLITLGS